MKLMYDLEADYVFPVKDRTKRLKRMHEKDKNSGREFAKSLTHPSSATTKRYKRLAQHKAKTTLEISLKGSAYKKLVCLDPDW